MPTHSRNLLALMLGLALLAACSKTPAQWMAKARQDAGQGRHEKAVDDYDKALAQPGPHARTAQFEKAQSLLQLQRWDDAARSALESAQGQGNAEAYPARVLALRAMAGSGDAAEGARILALIGPAAWADPVASEAARRLGLAPLGNSSAAPNVLGKGRKFDITRVNAVQIDIASVSVQTALPDPAQFPKQTRFQDPRQTVKVPSPDGKWLVWRGLEKGKGYYLFLSAANGSGQQRLDQCKNGYQPVWSPDSKRILYSAMDWQSEERNLFIYTLETKKERRAFNATSKVGPLASWSPDGSKIVFTYFDELWVVNANGIGRGLLNLGGRMKIQVVDAELFAWSADGSRLAYKGRRDPKTYLIDLTSKI